jgi:hypothetical protein
MENTNYDCEDFNSAICPKGVTSIINNIVSKDVRFIFTGCWGVYCKTGKNKQFKLKDTSKKDKEKKVDTQDASKYVVYGGKDVAEAMIEYSKRYNITAVILAGDNVYSDYPSDEQLKYIKKITEENNKDEIKRIKYELYNMDKQFVVGFEKCIRRVIAKDFLVGIGNHDVETCGILNKQLNYPEWTMMGLYYNYKYKLNDGQIINLVFIDTNIYEGKSCTGSPYPHNAKVDQLKWLEYVLNENKDSWNIVIGHIPFLANSHKEGKSLRLEPNLQQDLTRFENLIDLYMCADEHNQQYITYPKMPKEIISGAGGGILDENMETVDVLISHTKYRQSKMFGFVGMLINSENIFIEFVTAGGNIKDKRNKFKIYKKR